VDSQTITDFDDKHASMKTQPNPVELLIMISPPKGLLPIQTFSLCSLHEIPPDGILRKKQSSETNRLEETKKLGYIDTSFLHQ
jgi:hypothetical protein